MIAPIILTTTRMKESLHYRHENGKFNTPIEYARIILDAHDILRVIEETKTQHIDVCKVSYALEEKPDKDAEESTSVQHVRVRNSLDEIMDLMTRATTDDDDMWKVL